MLLHRYCLLQIVALIVLVAMLFSLHHAHYNSAELREAVASVKRSVSRVKTEIELAHEHEVRLNNDFAIWREISNTHVYSENENRNISVYEIIEGLCIRHKVLSEEILISQPIDVSGNYKKRYINVAKSRIKMKFSALTDKHAMLFVHALKYDVPGFVAMKLFEITKEGEITEEVVASANAGLVSPTVRGKIVFDLYKISERRA